MTRLIDIKAGLTCVFVRTHGQGRERMQRLADMGLLPGEPIKVLQNQGHGPVTIYIKGSRVALGHGMSEFIEVEALKNE